MVLADVLINRRRSIHRPLCLLVRVVGNFTGLPREGRLAVIGRFVSNQEVCFVMNEDVLTEGRRSIHCPLYPL